MGMPWSLPYRPDSEVTMSSAVWAISGVCSWLISVPWPVMNLSRFGICSRSLGTFGSSRRKCTLSNWM